MLSALTNSERLLYSVFMMNATKEAVSMSCQTCNIECQRFGKHRNGLRRFRCAKCRKTYTESHERTLGTMYVPQDRAVLALQLLLEGNSIRSTERITNLDRNTIMRLLVLAGERCQRLMDDAIKAIPVRDVEADEIWGFVGKKEGHKLPTDAGVAGIGDAYCFVAMERNTKLVLAFHLGKRNRIATETFLTKLRRATADKRFQLSTDGFQPYVRAVDYILSDRVDFAQIIKIYGTASDGETRYSPGEVIDTEVVPVMGNPDMRRVCTSHIERQNLTIRMGMRRMTRLSNAFSKKWEHLEAAYALHFAYYNFCRVHKTLRVTPAMETGIANHIWTIAELIA
jgi:transposase-like protein/IS1 family transposase